MFVMFLRWLCYVTLRYVMLRYAVMVYYVMSRHVMLTVPSASARTLRVSKPVPLIKTNGVHLHRSSLKMSTISAPILTKLRSGLVVLIPFLIYTITSIYRQACRFVRKDGRTDSTKLIVAFRNCLPDVSKTSLRETEHKCVGCMRVAEYRHLVKAFVTAAMNLR